MFQGSVLPSVIPSPLWQAELRPFNVKNLGRKLDELGCVVFARKLLPKEVRFVPPYPTLNSLTPSRDFFKVVHSFNRGYAMFCNCYISVVIIWVKKCV